MFESVCSIYLQRNLSGTSDEPIFMYDALRLILSDASMNSIWVKIEVLADFAGVVNPTVHVEQLPVRIANRTGAFRNGRRPGFITTSKMGRCTR